MSNATRALAIRDDGVSLPAKARLLALPLLPPRFNRAVPRHNLKAVRELVEPICRKHNVPYRYATTTSFAVRFTITVVIARNLSSALRHYHPPQLHKSMGGYPGDHLSP